MAKVKKTLSDEVKKRYSFERNTFSVLPNDKLRVEVGDSKQEDFYPQFKVQKWDNEANFSARLVHDEANPTVETKGDQIHWKGNKVETKFYELAPSPDLEEGGFEFEVVLKEKPAQNYVEFTIQTKGLEFYYQPALTEEEIANGDERPENVVGSYAIYKTGNYGKKDYTTGKVGHIYRPKIYDARGSWVWGELSIDPEAGKLRVTIPPMFLVRAKYPVYHAAGLTFGYTTVGATSANFTGSIGSIATGAAGTISSLHFYGRKQGGGGAISLYAALYGVTGTTPTTLLTSETAAVSLTTTVQWRTVNVTPYVSPGAANYSIAQGGRSSGITYYSDAGAANQLCTGTMTGAWPAGGWATAYQSRIMSAYATYTAPGGGTSWSWPIAETVTVSESLAKRVGSRRTDTVLPVDQDFETGQARLADNVTVSESLKNNPDKYLTETVTVAESLAPSTAKVLTETVTVSESLGKAIYATITETVGVQDSLSGPLSAGLNDMVVTSDELTATVTYLLSLTEDVTVEDNLFAGEDRPATTFMQFADGRWQLVVNGVIVQEYF